MSIKEERMDEMEFYSKANVCEGDKFVPLVSLIVILFFHYWRSGRRWKLGVKGKKGREYSASRPSSSDWGRPEYFMTHVPKLDEILKLLHGLLCSSWSPLVLK